MTGETFAAAVLARDLDAMERLLAEDVVFRSPAVFKPYEGKQATMVLLDAVTRVFEDFRVMVRPLSGLQALVERMGEVIPEVMRERGLSS